MADNMEVQTIEEVTETAENPETLIFQDAQGDQDEQETQGSQDIEPAVKKRRRPHKLFWMLMKSIAIFWVPAIILLGVIIFSICRYPLLHRYSCHEVNSISEMRDWYDEQCYNVVYRATDLKYTGYDYYENDNLVGAYYYTFENDRCLFVLLRTKKPAAEILEAKIRGKLLRESVYMETVIEQFSADVGMERDEFMQIVSPIMLSEPDYPWTQIFLIWVLVIIPMILAGITVFLGVEWMTRPYMHPHMKQLEAFGDKKEVYHEINAQLNRDNVFHQHNYYFTDDYLIFDLLGHLDFVRMDRVRYISKHATRDKKQRQRYRLIMSDDEWTYYDRSFRSEEDVDNIMKEMIARNDQIDDRTLHVFHLPEENAAESPAVSRTAAETATLTDDRNATVSEPAQAVSETTQSVQETAAVYEEPMQNTSAEKEIGIHDAEDLKIYKVRHRLRKKEEDADNVKIYNVRRRLRKSDDHKQKNENTSDNKEKL